MGTVKAENYPDNGQCISGYCTKRNDKQNITLLHGRIQDIGWGARIDERSVSWRIGGEGEHGTVTPLDPPILGYRSDKNNAYYYQKFYSLQSYYSLWTQKRKFSEYGACEYGYVENVKFML